MDALLHLACSSIDPTAFNSATGVWAGRRTVPTLPPTDAAGKGGAVVAAGAGAYKVREDSATLQGRILLVALGEFLGQLFSSGTQTRLVAKPDTGSTASADILVGTDGWQHWHTIYTHMQDLAHVLGSVGWLAG